MGQEGLLDFGENYVQEWRAKQEDLLLQDQALALKIHWHFIGHLQSNKIKEVVGKVDYLHTVDSLSLAQKISDFASARQITQKALMEVKLGGESSKTGFAPEKLLEDLASLGGLAGLNWEGLMAIPPPGRSPEETRPFFAQLKSLLDECNQSGFFNYPLKELSMGMSEDFEVAIEEGATMVRIGTALFGART